MTEALEYRLKSLKIILAYVAALIAMVGGLVIAVGSLLMDSPSRILMLKTISLAIMVVAVILFTTGLAHQRDSWAREFWSRWYSLEDPPIEDWSEQLEAEGAFQAREYNE